MWSNKKDKPESHLVVRSFWVEMWQNSKKKKKKRCIKRFRVSDKPIFCASQSWPKSVLVLRHILRRHRSPKFTPNKRDSKSRGWQSYCWEWFQVQLRMVFTFLSGYQKKGKEERGKQERKIRQQRPWAAYKHVAKAKLFIIWPITKKRRKKVANSGSKTITLRDQEGLGAYILVIKSL